MANPSRNSWSCFLEDALWAHKITYRTPLGMSPYQIVFGKACHLPVEIENQAYWAIKKCNMAYDQASRERKLLLQELEELCMEAYENSRIYKEKEKHFHDSRILRKEFKVGQKVLLFNSQLKLIAGKLHSRWSGPFVVTNVFPYGIAEIPTKALPEGPILSSNEGEVEVLTFIEPIPNEVKSARGIRLGQTKPSRPTPSRSDASRPDEANSMMPTLSSTVKMPAPEELTLKADSVPR
ncbi:hypothetical protein CR513_28977, partial [Mucuna pruriens]